MRGHYPLPSSPFSISSEAASRRFLPLLKKKNRRRTEEENDEEEVEENEGEEGAVRDLYTVYTRPQWLPTFLKVFHSPVQSIVLRHDLRDRSGHSFGKSVPRSKSIWRPARACCRPTRMRRARCSVHSRVTIESANPSTYHSIRLIKRLKTKRINC